MTQPPSLKCHLPLHMLPLRHGPWCGWGLPLILGQWGSQGDAGAWRRGSPEVTKGSVSVPQIWGPCRPSGTSSQTTRPSTAATATGGLRACWLLPGWASLLPGPAGKIGVPSPSPSWGRLRRKLRAGSCPDLHKASTPWESGSSLAAAAACAPYWSPHQDPSVGMAT